MDMTEMEVLEKAIELFEIMEDSCKEDEECFTQEQEK